jgi:hypothetical protein
MVTERCSVVKPFDYNHTFVVVSGGAHFVNGDLRLDVLPPNPSMVHVDQPLPGGDHTYRSVFGPSVEHNGVIYADDDHNVNLAMRRLTASRPDEQQLIDNQHLFVQSVLPFLHSLSQQYSSHVEVWEHDSHLDEIERHVSDPHPKRRLREDAWRSLNNDGYHAQVSDRLWLNQVRYKMKKDEIAKPGKYPRMIGDLGVAASLQGMRATAIVKHAMAAEPIRYKNCRMTFVSKPEPSSMTEVFRSLLNDDGYNFFYFSDDSCISIQHGAKRVVYNLDISSCDGSHYYTFAALLEMVPEKLRAEFGLLVEQCSQPIRINSRDRLRHVKLRPLMPRLYSGSTLTTLINNLANILICKSIVDTNAFTPEEISAAAALAGFIVTVETCTQPEDIQFLKHSPVSTDAGWLPMLNLGVMLRSLGQCKGDLPGRGDIGVRARKFTYAYLAGMYPRVEFDLLRQLRSKTIQHTEHVYSRAAARMLPQFDVSPIMQVSDTALYRRYRLDLEEIAWMQTFGEVAHAFTSHRSPALSKILMKDYGLTA